MRRPADKLHCVFPILLLVALAVDSYGQRPEPQLTVLAEDSLHRGNLYVLTGEVQLESGARVMGKIETVEGDIYLEDNSEAGEIRSLNGEITIGANCRVGPLYTEEGGVEIGPGSRINGDIQSPKGDVYIEGDVTVFGDLKTELGDVEIEGATVRGDLITRHGDLSITEGATVKGSILIKPRSSELRGRGNELEIYIGPGAMVTGDIRVSSLKDSVYVVIEGGQVQGRMRNVFKEEEEK